MALLIDLGPVAQWIRHLTTDQGIPGSSPGRVEFFLLIFFLLFSYISFHIKNIRIIPALFIKLRAKVINMNGRKYV